MTAVTMSPSNSQAVRSAPARSATLIANVTVVRHTLRKTPRSRCNPQWRNATRAGNEVVGEHVERIQRRSERAPQEDSGQCQEEPRALEQHADGDKTADDSGLHHQRCIQTLVGVSRLEALLENEPEV